jgi:hypothetical protein
MSKKKKYASCDICNGAGKTLSKSKYKEFDECYHCKGAGRIPLHEKLIEEIKAITNKIDGPEYYGGKDNPLETIKIIEANGWGWGFCMGSALKYLTRAGKKNSEETEDDLDKGIWYLERAKRNIPTG